MWIGYGYRGGGNPGTGFQDENVGRYSRVRFVRATIPPRTDDNALLLTGRYVVVVVRGKGEDDE